MLFEVLINRIMFIWQTSPKSLKCKCGFSDSKPWDICKSWIIPSLKLNWDASEGNTLHEGVAVLVGFMLSLKVPNWFWSCALYWEWLSPWSI